MKKKGFRIKTLSKVACCIAVLVGVVLLCFAVYFQHRVAKNNKFFSQLRDNPHMKGGGPFYHQMVSFNALMRTTIPLLTTIGIMLCIVGGFLLLFPKRTMLAFLLIAVILLPSLPVTYGVDTEAKDRWWAQLTLQHNANGMSAEIYIYDNYLDYTGPSPWVAFRIGIGRDDGLGNREWIESGFIEDDDGFWIYGASFIDGIYHENIVTRLAGEGAGGEGYLLMSIAEREPNQFEAVMYDIPPPGMWYLIGATFTLGGNNKLVCGSESNYPLNSLNGHYDNLYWSDGDSGGPWQDIEIYADSPYSVTMGASNNEFFTEGGGNFYTLTISASSGGTTNPTPGTYPYSYGSSVTVTASANSGYMFNHWILDGAVKYSNPITVTMDSDRTLKAYFESEEGSGGSGGGGGGDGIYFGEP